MQSLLEFAPLVAFFVAYKYGGIYTATSVLMVAMALLLLVDFIRLRRIPTMHGLSALLVFAFGAATLILHNQRFIQWKPTVFFWLVSIAFLLSFWIGKQPLVQRFLSSALESTQSVPEVIWRRLNWLWVVFCAGLGAVNLAIAFNLPEKTWVNFKVIGLPIATALFVGLQAFWLMRRVAQSSEQPPAQA